MEAIRPSLTWTSPTLKTHIAEMTHQTTKEAAKKKNTPGIANTRGVVPTKSAAASTIDTQS